MTARSARLCDLGRPALAVVAMVCMTASAGAQGPPPAPGAAADTVPPFMRDVRLEQRLNARLPLEATFVDSGGNRLRLGDLFGARPVVLAFVYFECPMLCSQVLQSLVRAMRPLDMSAGREFDVVVISFDAANTAVEAKAQKDLYRRRYARGSDGLHFLTGRPDAIEAVTGAAGFHFRYDGRAGLFFHPATIVVATPTGRISRYLTGIEYAPRDLKLALMDASEERVGSLVDRLQLYCYQYDPETGRYGLVVFRLLRGGAVLMVAALGILLAGTWWRERRLARLEGRS